MKSLSPTAQKILLTILKHTAGAPTISMIKEELKMTHVGIWKSLKKLETEEMIILKSIGNKKNSIYTIYLNFDNSLLAKTLTLALEYEANYQRRWQITFAELEKCVDFLIIYGSTLHYPKEANDIDILEVISNRKNITKIEEINIKLQKTQLKKIHAIDITKEELKRELKKPNIAFINAIKEGVVLLGQDKFINFVRKVL